MNLKRYRVNNIKEALKFIKRDLGPDALIVSTRQVKEGKGAFGMFGKTMLEVTASAGEKKKNSAASKVPATKVLEAYNGVGDTAENALAETFMRPQTNSVLSVTDQTRNMMLPIQKELQGIRLTLGDLSSQSNAFDNHLVGDLKHELGEMRHMLHI